MFTCTDRAGSPTHHLTTQQTCKATGLASPGLARAPTYAGSLGIVCCAEGMRTAQKRQPRVHVSPRSITVAVPVSPFQHCGRRGGRDASHVCQRLSIAASALPLLPVLGETTKFGPAHLADVRAHRLLTDGVQLQGPERVLQVIVPDSAFRGSSVSADAPAWRISERARVHLANHRRMDAPVSLRCPLTQPRGLAEALRKPNRLWLLLLHARRSLAGHLDELGERVNRL